MVWGRRSSSRYLGVTVFPVFTATGGPGGRPHSSPGVSLPVLPLLLLLHTEGIHRQVASVCGRHKAEL